MKTRAFVGIALLSLALASPAQVTGLRRPRQRLRVAEVPPLLSRAIQAQPTLRYTGTYTTEFRQGGNQIRHQEFITRDGSWYRIDFPNDSQFAGQVVIENSDVRLHYHPIQNEIMQQPPRHGEAWEKVANLGANRRLNLRVETGETVAGLRTDQLVVADKDGNVTQRLFIEPGSGVIMKRLLFDKVGTQIGFFEFSQIDLNPRIDPSVFQIKRKNAKLVTPKMQLERVSKRRGFMVWYLPPGSGYALEGAVPRNFAGVEGLVQTYVNGTDRLWIYVLKAPADSGRLRNGAGKNLHVHSFDSMGETIVLMGTVDDRTLSKFASMMMGGTSPVGR